MLPRYLHRLLPVLLLLISLGTDHSATGFQPTSHVFANRPFLTSVPSKQETGPAGSYSGRGLNSWSTALYENKSQDGKRGYQFGDITKAVTKSLIGKRVSKLTGKPYEFGDLSRKIDESIKDKIVDLTGKDDYEFGDLSRWVDAQIKSEVNKYTNKDNYKFGDLSKEIARRVVTGEYTLDDLFLLLKALALIEASISPVAGFMPVKLLIELLNFSIANDVAGRVSSALAMELDRRLKKSLLGNENYQLGDATKQAISSAITAYTGKDSYSFGDVTRKVVASFAEDGNRNADRPLLGMKTAKEMEPSIIEALDKWDGLSEKEMEKSLAALEKYVEQVEIDDAKIGNSSKKT